MRAQRPLSFESEVSQGRAGARTAGNCRYRSQPDSRRVEQCLQPDRQLADSHTGRIADGVGDGRFGADVAELTQTSRSSLALTVWASTTLITYRYDDSSCFLVNHALVCPLNESLPTWNILSCEDGA